MNGPPPVHLATVNGHSAEAAPSAALVAHIYTRAGSLYYHGIALTQTVRRTRALMTSSLLGVMMMHGTVNNVLLYNHTTTSSTTQSSSCSPRHRHDVTIIYMLNRDISIQSVCGTAQFFSGCCVVLSTTPLVAYERFCCGRSCCCGQQYFRPSASDAHAYIIVVNDMIEAEVMTHD